MGLEALCGCTTCIVKGDPLQAKGKLFLARTLDWDMPVLREFTIEVSFVQKKKEVFRATTWAGYVGVLTGLRRGSFAAAVNFRSRFVAQCFLSLDAL